MLHKVRSNLIKNAGSLARTSAMETPIANIYTLLRKPQITLPSKTDRPKFLSTILGEKIAYPLYKNFSAIQNPKLPSKTGIRSFATDAEIEDNTYVINPGESDIIYAGIFTTFNEQSYRIYITESDGMLNICKDDPYVLSTSHLRSINKEITPASNTISWQNTTAYLEKNWLNFLTNLNQVFVGKLPLKEPEKPYLPDPTMRSYEMYPQKEWLNFLAHLDQFFVSKFQLEKPENRFLIEYYNFYHNSADPIIKRNRSTAMKSLPWPFFNGLYAQGYQEFMKEIDAGNSTIEAAKKHFFNLPAATNGFIQRIAYSHRSTKEITSLGIFLQKIATKDGKFNKEIYNNIIGIIPSSKESPELFEAMYKVFFLSSLLPLTEAGKESIFLNSSRDWQGNNLLKDDNITGDRFYQNSYDYFKAITKDLVLPEYYSRLRALHSPDGIPEHLTTPMHLARTLHEQLETVSTSIFASLSLSKLAEYSDRWHRNQFLINSKKPAPNNQFNETEWHALFPDQNINGIAYKVLTSHSQLSQEGEEMDHCVSGYSDDCKEGKCHIISGKSESEESFTLHIINDNGKFENKDVVGYLNSEVSIEIEAEVELLLEKINEGTIETNKNFGTIKFINDIGLINGEQNLENYFGFNLFDKQIREEIFQAHKGAGVLPKPFQRCTSLDEFMKVSGLSEVYGDKAVNNNGRNAGAAR